MKRVTVPGKREGADIIDKTIIEYNNKIIAKLEQADFCERIYIDARKIDEFYEYMVALEKEYNGHNEYWEGFSAGMKALYEGMKGLSVTHYLKVLSIDE